MPELRIAIKDDASALQWLAQAMLIHEEYEVAMREASDVHKQAEDFADGTMVDELYELGTNFLNASEKVANEIKEIATTVNAILDKANIFKNTVSGALGFVKDLIG